MPDPLSLDDISIHYPLGGDEWLKVVDGFSLHLHAGEMVCLAGRSGSGKTSLLRVAHALQTPQHGTVRWDGQATAEMPPATLAAMRRTYIGYMDQSAQVIDYLSSADNVLLALMHRRVSADERARGMMALEEVGLADRASAPAGTLSGGERQRLVLARTLLPRPTVVLVDEPTANVDSANAEVVLERLEQARQEGTAILAASHDPSVLRSATRVQPLVAE